MPLATTIFSVLLSLCPESGSCAPIPNSGASYIPAAYEHRNQLLIQTARERARMLRNNELTTENPIHNAILYKKLITLIAAYEAGKVSENVFHVLIVEFQSISGTGTINHKMANEWLDEYKLYLEMAKKSGQR